MLGVLTLVLLSACAPGSQEAPEATGRSPSPAPEDTAPDTPGEVPDEAEVGDRIALDALPSLPDEGVVVQLEEGLVFVDLDGGVHGHVPGATLETARGLQHVPAGLVPVGGDEYGPAWLEPSSGELVPGYWGTPLLGDANALLDPHAGSPDAYVIHRPDEAVAQWERDDRWWLSTGHRAVTWERCPDGDGDPSACPRHGHDLATGADLELDPGCWVADTRADAQLRVCTDGDAEPKSWLELAPPGEEPERYELPRHDDVPDDMPTIGHFLSGELAEGWILAQASMECEMRSAALIDIDSGELKPTLGEDEPLTVASIALGRTGDGRAAVLVDDGPCAESETPGVWLVDPTTDEADLVYPLPADSSAQGHLWRPVPGIDLAARTSAEGVDEE